MERREKKRLSVRRTLTAASEQIVTNKEQSRMMHILEAFPWTYKENVDILDDYAIRWKHRVTVLGFIGFVRWKVGIISDFETFLISMEILPTFLNLGDGR